MNLPSMGYCSVAKSCLTLCDPMNCNTSVFPAFTIVWSLLKLIYIVSGMPSNHLICCPLLLLPSIFPSIRVFFKESALCNTWPKYCSFSFSPSEEYLGLTHLVSLQSKGLKNLLQYHNLKTSILLFSDFFMVQLLHPYMTTGKTIALILQTFIGKVVSLLLNMLPKFVITFLPKSKCLLILWLQYLSAVILEHKKIKFCHCFHCFPIYLPWSYGTGWLP